MYSWNIFTPLSLKYETFSHALLVISFLYKILRNILALTLRIPLINGITSWRHECGHMTFPGKFYDLCNFLVEMLTFNPIQHGHFRGYWRMGGGPKRPPLPRICHTYPTMMKLGTIIPYLKKIQKLYQSRDTPLSSADISIFSREISKFCYIKKYRYRLHFDT